MQLLDDYLTLQQQIYDYFAYVEEWRVFPIDDSRQYYWRILTETRLQAGTGERYEYESTVQFADTPELLGDLDGDYYENEVCHQRHLPKWVYRGEDYTMIVVDTHTDGNQFLQIFANDREVK